jgi:hypothetical protein
LSRNRDRLGTNAPQSEGLPPQMTHENNDEGNSFSFVVPTEFVELPSKGRFYPQGHPLHMQETVEIKHMTAKEEDMLTSRALLKKGIALDRVVSSLIVNKSIKHESLLVGDRNAIMVAARISGYGSEYKTKIGCPQCGASQDYNFDLFDASIEEGTASAELGVKEVGNGLFSTLLPRLNCEVTFRLLNGHDEKILLDQITNARKRNKLENTVTRQLRSIIVAVNGDNTRQNIDNLIANLPTIDSQHLRTAFSLATPNIDLTQFFSCDECGHETEMEVPLTSDFFWPR